MYGYDREKLHVNHLWELKSLKKKSVVKGGVGGGGKGAFFELYIF